MNNETNTAEVEVKLHPFESAGMGRGPYVYAGFFSIPSTSLAEANPEAYNNALRSMPKLNGGCGTCSNCGMAIMNVCVVRDADGGLWGVGCDCIAKVGEPSLSNPAKIALAKHQAALRHARELKAREARRQAWLATIDPKTGETNAQRLAREAAEKEAVNQNRLAAQGARAVEFADVLTHLQGNDFFTSLGEQLKRGPVSERQAFYVAKAVFGRISKKNQAEADALIEKITK